MMNVKSNIISINNIYLLPPIIIISIFLSQFFLVDGVYLIHRVAISLLVTIGTLGAFLNNTRLLKIGILGAWYFFCIVIATAIPDEEYYYFNNIELPSKTFVIINLSSLTIIFLFILYLFRKKMTRKGSKVQGGGTDDLSNN